MPPLSVRGAGDDVLTSRRRLFGALVAAAAIVLSAPFMGQIRAALQSSLPSGGFRILVGACLVGAVAFAIGAAVVRVREHRGRRYGALIVALTIALVYARATSSGNPSVDVVERFHFVEYGLLAMLFYRVWQYHGDVSTLIAPSLAAISVATLDEWLQWFVPARVGELRDVVLDGVAIGCGLLFVLGLDPPARMNLRLTPHTVRTAGLLAIAALVLCALFFDVVHLAQDVQIGRATTFRSRFSPAALEAHARDRAFSWGREGPPIELHRLSREDQYMAEGIWHVQRRNEASAANDAFTAWRENVILERFFAPVLDWPSYAAPTPSRWPPPQRAEVQALAAGDTRTYVSEAARYPLYTWDRRMFWMVVAVMGITCGVCSRRYGRVGELLAAGQVS
jgi:hypothetical protein